MEGEFHPCSTGNFVPSKVLSVSPLYICFSKVIGPERAPDFSKLERWYARCC